MSDSTAPTFNLDAFRDPALAHKLIGRISKLAEALAATERFGGGQSIKLMEVCGTHTMAIAKAGLRSVMPENIVLSSGPGCPVCVTANPDIDLAIEVARQPGMILTTFGDMIKVPGSWTSLAQEKARGADVRVVYSPLDALALAAEAPEALVVFVSVGFETTTPIIAASVKRAAAAGLENFCILAANKTVPEALRALAGDPEVGINGLILPGHVSTIIGTAPYQFLADEFGVPGVVTGFEPVDVLLGIEELLKGLLEISEGAAAKISIAYERAVKPEGNPVAVALLDEIFEPCDVEWRGLGVIGGTGLKLRENYARFDATVRVPVTPPESRETPGCQCGQVLRGIITPPQCRLFGRGCVPEHPVGPCMVSSEGSCAAFYRYRDVSDE
ncbi:MAG: hydrogenase formation protein HypD [Coriobacteriia bacterium]|nr:hydrogenase formation protein HypD [Coriobacteriia bacterium]